MRLQDNIDFTTLTWVKPELDDTLKQARNALQNYVEEGENPHELKPARAPAQCRSRCACRVLRAAMWPRNGAAGERDRRRWNREVAYGS